VKYVYLVECSETPDNRNKYAPDFFFFNVRLFVLVAGDLLKQIPVVSILQYNTEGPTLLIYKCLVVGANAGVIYTRQYSHFIQRIFFLFV